MAEFSFVPWEFNLLMFYGGISNLNDEYIKWAGSVMKYTA